MRFKLSICFFILSLFLLSYSFTLATTAPTITGPNPTTTDTSPKLTWEYTDPCSASERCFKVEVDDFSDFSSLNRNTYTNNLYYSPQLSIGKWYFRVKAKDQTNTWSGYSSGSFEIVAESQNNSPTPTQTPEQSTTSNNSGSKSTASFEIFQIPSSIKSDESFTVKVKFTGYDANSNYYFKGAFFKEGSVNYFGKTFVSGNWIKNSENFAKQYPTTTNSNGDYDGEIKLMVDPDDSGFDGSGSYKLKVGRYNSSGSGPNWSNEQVIQINYIETQKQDTTAKSSTKQTSPTPNPKAPISQTDSSFIKTSKAAAKPKVLGVKPQIPIATVSGASTKSAQVQESTTPTIVKSELKINWYFIGSGIIVLLFGSLLFIYNLKTVKKS